MRIAHPPACRPESRGIRQDSHTSCDNPSRQRTGKALSSARWMRPAACIRNRAQTGSIRTSRLRIRDHDANICNESQISATWVTRQSNRTVTRELNTSADRNQKLQCNPEFRGPAVCSRLQKLSVLTALSILLRMNSTMCGIAHSAPLPDKK